MYMDDQISTVKSQSSPPSPLQQQPPVVQPISPTESQASVDSMQVSQPSVQSPTDGDTASQLPASGDIPVPTPALLPQQSVVGSSMHKEAAPMPSQGVNSGELLHPTEQAPKLPEAVEKAGVEVPKDKESAPDLTMHDKNLVQHAPVIAPVQTHPTGTVQLPMTEEKAWEAVKTEDPKSSGWARALQITKIFKKLHQKIIGG